MLLGHYAVALAAKRYAPRTSLGTLILAAQLLDLLWALFFLSGWEELRIVPGITKASPLQFVRYPISHSLLTTLLWGFALAVAYYVMRRYRGGAKVLFAAVVSHWFLDLVMHRPDLPLWPGSAPRLGFGLWNSLAATGSIATGSRAKLMPRQCGCLRCRSWPTYKGQALQPLTQSPVEGVAERGQKRFRVFVLCCVWP